MHRTILRLLSFILLTLTLASGCEPPMLDGEAAPSGGRASETAQRRQGITSTLKGKVRAFNQGLAVAVDVFGLQPGCTFQLDAHSGKTLSVVVNGIDTGYALAADGMCKLAFDSLKSGAEVSVNLVDDTWIASIGVER